MKLGWKHSLSWRSGRQYIYEARCYIGRVKVADVVLGSGRWIWMHHGGEWKSLGDAKTAVVDALEGR